MSYAAYGSGNHRRHNHRLLVVLKVSLYAAIFIKCECSQIVYKLFGDCLHIRLVNCYLVFAGSYGAWNRLRARFR